MLKCTEFSCGLFTVQLCVCNMCKKVTDYMLTILTTWLVDFLLSQQQQRSMTRIG